jgi:hypothetical protein
MSYESTVRLIEETNREIDQLTRKKKKLEEILAEETGSPRPDGKKLWEMAKTVLDRERKPLHTKEVAKRIEEEFKTRVNVKSLSQVLHAKAKAKKYFFKDKKEENTYGLKEWDEQ